MKSKPVALALVAMALLAGCGGSGAQAAKTTTTATTTRAPSTRSSTTSARTSGDGSPNALAFSRCMRAHGVPNFPDPQPGGGFMFHASAATIASPTFRAAQAKCGSLLPGPAGPGAQNESPQVKAKALAQLRHVAACMRRHGVPDFPDPTLAAPATGGLIGKYSEITNYEGVFLLFPASIDMQSPAWNQAAAACGALAESFNHPHH